MLTTATRTGAAAVKITAPSTDMAAVERDDCYAVDASWSLTALRTTYNENYTC